MSISKKRTTFVASISKFWNMFISFTRKDNGVKIFMNVETIEKIEAVEGGCAVYALSDEEAILVKESFAEIDKQLKSLGLTAE
jgi:uncharacterized protein YlzI (FlbEa/FlbD family)